MAAPKGPTRPEYAAVRDYVRQHPDVQPKHVRDRFPALLISTARGWTHKARAELGIRAPGNKPFTGDTGNTDPVAPFVPPAPPDPVHVDSRVPVIQMSETDRTIVYRTVRDIYATIGIVASRIREAAELTVKGELPALDKDLTTATQNLMRTAAGLVDMHPGVMKMVEQTGGSSKGINEDDMAIVLGVLKGAKPAS